MSEIVKETTNMQVEEVPSEAAITDEMNFSEALEASLSAMSTDQKVKGVVMGITPTEIQVDIGRKHAGFVPMDEYSADPTANAAKELKIGDEIDLIIMKTNDAEGTVMLSKKRFDAQKSWVDIVEAAEDGRILEGTVAEVIKGGIFNTIAVDGGKLTFNSYVVSDLKEDEEGNIIDENEVPTVTLHDSFTLEKEVGQNEITFTGDNTTSEAAYYLGAVPSFFGLAIYTFIEWLPRVLVMLPALLVDVVFMDGSF